MLTQRRLIFTICFGLFWVLPLFESGSLKAEPLTAHQIRMVSADWVYHVYQYPSTVERRVWFRAYPTFDAEHYDHANPLYFRHQVPGEPWKYFRATGLLIPSYNLVSQPDREAVEGFELSNSSKGIQRFHYLNGITLSGGPKDPKAAFFYEVRPGAVQADSQTADDTLSANSTAANVEAVGSDTSPQIPTLYLLTVEAGHFLRFWNQVPPTRHDTLSVRWVYDEFLYFQSNGKRYRAIYIMTPPLPGGRSDVFGFHVSATGGPLKRFTLSQVKFLDTDRPTDRSAINVVPVGSIVASMLSPSAFRRVTGDPAVFDPAKSHWATADDRGQVPGSDYSRATNNASLPDLRGMFLRGLNIGRNDGMQDPEGTGRIAGSYQADAFTRHRHRGFSPSWQQNPRSNVAWARNNHGWNYVGSTADTSEAGQSETRARNIAVYYYVRINN